MCSSSKHRRRRIRREERQPAKTLFSLAQWAVVLFLGLLAFHELRRTLSRKAREKSARARYAHIERRNKASELSTGPAENSAEQSSVEWFRESSHSGQTSNSVEGLASSQDDMSAAAANVMMKGGLVLLPPLSEPESETKRANGEVGTGSNESTEARRSSLVALSSFWNAISHADNVDSLPPHLKAVAVYSAQMLHGNRRDFDGEGDSSIFSARRKGVWMGCTQPYHLICKGVYRAIKRLNAVTILDTKCIDNTQWLPLVLRHMKKEFRLVKLICSEQDASKLDRAHLAYKDFEHITYTQFDPFHDIISNRTDLVIAVKLLQHETLIRSMKFFKLLENNSNVGHVIYENYHDSSNRPTSSKETSDNVILLNTFAAPFHFGAPAYRYENPEDQPPSENVEIVAIGIGQLFEYKSTPTMAELMGPTYQQGRS